MHFISNRTKTGRYINPVSGLLVDEGRSLGYAALQPHEGKCWCLQFPVAGMWGLVLENILTTGMEDEPPFCLKNLPLCCHGDKAVLQVAPCTFNFLDKSGEFHSLRLQPLNYHCS